MRVVLAAPAATPRSTPRAVPVDAEWGRVDVDWEPPFGKDPGHGIGHRLLRPEELEEWESNPRFTPEFFRGWFEQDAGTYAALLWLTEPRWVYVDKEMCS